MKLSTHIKRCTLLAFAALLLTQISGWTMGQRKDESLQVQLGARLFVDNRFSSPNGDLQSSCSSCHLFNEDPQGRRAYTDFLARSWVAWRSKDPRRDGVRNAPTILDSSEMPRLHFDGEFQSMEELVRGTISGRTLGWLPGEEEQALDHAWRVVLDDKGEEKAASYRDQFRQAYGVELDKIKRDEVISLVARAISDFVRTLKTEKNSPFDRFIEANGLPNSPAQGEAAAAFAERMIARITSMESKGDLRLTKEFSADALRGMKIFFRVKGEASVGNCAVCHTPPLFTDFSFHNTGISQSEYDRLHGEGSFAALRVSASARPSVQFREIPHRNKPEYTDLGHWNFVKTDSPLRRAGESDAEFLERMVGTFKTPTLRNLAFSYPYMHNGAFPTLESALGEVARLAGLARAGRVRAADEELARIKISESDIALLVAFLNTLNE
ncbi:MAG: cytochrome c peroxidase [Acidobacteriota bacterium]